MGQSYQVGRPSAPPSWGWPNMTLGNDVAMLVMTMVGVGDISPPNEGDGSFGPSKKGQPNIVGHSNGEHEWWPWWPLNPKKARASVGSTRGGREPPRQPTPTMTTPIGGPWICPP